MPSKRTPHALLFLLALAVPAVHAAEFKVGFVNVAKVLEQAPQATEARSRIEKEFQPRDRELVAQQKEVRNLEDRLIKNAAVMSASERSRQEEQIRKLKRELRRSQDEFREDLNLKRSEELSKLQRKVTEVIRALAKSGSYDLILTDGVIHAGKRVDITEKVLESLGSEFKATGAN